MPDLSNAERAQEFRSEDLKTLEKAVRRIVRAHDLNSKALIKSSGLTSAQLVIMKGIAELGEVTSTALSDYADISLATVVTVLDNLEERGLIQRYRSGQDRRIVHTRLTEAGMSMIASAPPPLGQSFADRFAAIGERRRRELVAAAGALADMLSPPSTAMGGVQSPLIRAGSAPVVQGGERRVARQGQDRA